MHESKAQSSEGARPGSPAESESELRLGVAVRGLRCLAGVDSLAGLGESSSGLLCGPWQEPPLIRRLC